MRKKGIMVSLVSPLVFATAVAIPSAQAQEGSDSPPKTAAAPQSVQAPAERPYNCSAWHAVDTSLVAAVCIYQQSAGSTRFWVRAWVHNRSGIHLTFGAELYFRVGHTWATGRNYLRGSCGKGVAPGTTVFCDTPWTTIRAANQWKWGVARVHTENGQRVLWNPRALR